MQALKSENTDSSLIRALFRVLKIVNILRMLIENLSKLCSIAELLLLLLRLLDPGEVGTESFSVSTYYEVGHCVCTVFALPAVFRFLRAR